MFCFVVFVLFCFLVWVGGSFCCLFYPVDYAQCQCRITKMNNNNKTLFGEGDSLLNTTSVSFCWSVIKLNILLSQDDLTLFCLNIFFTGWQKHIGIANHTCYLTQSRYHDTGPTSPTHDPMCQASGMTVIRLPIHQQLELLSWGLNNQLGNCDCISFLQQFRLNWCLKETGIVLAFHSLMLPTIHQQINSRIPPF